MLHCRRCRNGNHITAVATRIQRKHTTLFLPLTQEPFYTVLPLRHTLAGIAPRHNFRLYPGHLLEQCRQIWDRHVLHEPMRWQDDDPGIVYVGAIHHDGVVGSYRAASWVLLTHGLTQSQPCLIAMMPIRNHQRLYPA